MSKCTYIVSRTSISLHLADGTSGSIRLDHPEIEEIKAIIRKPDLDDADEAYLRALLSPKAAVAKALDTITTGEITFDGTQLLLKGQPLHVEASRRIVEIAQNGFDVTRMLKFMDRLVNNPYPTAVNELWQFMEASGLPIDEDGHLIAYKIVRDDYKDIYTGTFDNSIGASPEVKPFEVDPDRNNTCSRGLHVCGKDYLPAYGNAARGSDRIMIVRVDPAQVVTVPADYGFHKMRCWKYTVVGEIEGIEKAGILESRGIYNTGDNRDNGFDYGDTLSEEQRAKAMQEVDNSGWVPATPVHVADVPLTPEAVAATSGPADGINVPAGVASQLAGRFYVRDTHDSNQYYVASVAEVKAGFDGTGSDLFVSDGIGGFIAVTINDAENVDPSDSAYDDILNEVE